MKASIRSKAATPRRRPAPRGNERRLVTQHPRRRVLSLGAGAAPVRIVIRFAPGGPTDAFGRLLAQRLCEQLGKQFYVENAPGAGGNIATGRVAKASADGSTI